MEESTFFWACPRRALSLLDVLKWGSLRRTAGSGFPSKPLVNSPRSRSVPRSYGCLRFPPALAPFPARIIICVVQPLPLRSPLPFIFVILYRSRSVPRSLSYPGSFRSIPHAVLCTVLYYSFRTNSQCRRCLKQAFYDLGVTFNFCR